MRKWVMARWALVLAALVALWMILRPRSGKWKDLAVAMQQRAADALKKAARAQADTDKERLRHERDLQVQKENETAAAVVDSLDAGGDSGFLDRARAHDRTNPDP